MPLPCGTYHRLPLTTTSLFFHRAHGGTMADASADDFRTAARCELPQTLDGLRAVLRSVEPHPSIQLLV